MSSITHDFPNGWRVSIAADAKLEGALSVSAFATWADKEGTPWEHREFYHWTRERPEKDHQVCTTLPQLLREILAIAGHVGPIPF